MSLKKIKQVKEDKGFKIFDLVIYGAILLAVAAMFIAVFATRNGDPLTGVRIYYSAETVFEYEFGGEPVYSDCVSVEETDAGLTVTVTVAEGKNVLYIDKQAKTAKMAEADCNGKQCTYFAAISDNNGLIYCNPHKLRIEPLFKNLDSPDIIM